jgi:hypothetical protein
MKTKKSILKIVIPLLLGITILVSCGRTDTSPENTLKNFSKQIEQGNLEDLRLTIYYMNPNILTDLLSVDDLIYGRTAVNEPPREKNDKNGLYERKIVIDGTRLKDHIDLLKLVGSVKLTPARHKSRIDARIYFVFETEKEGKIFDVAMWGDNESIYVNGIEANKNDIFLDVIIPFLPAETVEAMKIYSSWGKKE